MNKIHLQQTPDFNRKQQRKCSQAIMHIITDLFAFCWGIGACGGGGAWY